MRARHLGTDTRDIYYTHNSNGEPKMVQVDLKEDF